MFIRMLHQTSIRKSFIFTITFCMCLTAFVAWNRCRFSRKVLLSFMCCVFVVNYHFKVYVLSAWNKVRFIRWRRSGRSTVYSWNWWIDFTQSCIVIGIFVSIVISSKVPTTGWSRWLYLKWCTVYGKLRYGILMSCYIIYAVYFVILYCMPYRWIVCLWFIISKIIILII